MDYLLRVTLTGSSAVAFVPVANYIHSKRVFSGVVKGQRISRHRSFPQSVIGVHVTVLPLLSGRAPRRSPAPAVGHKKSGAPGQVEAKGEETSESDSQLLSKRLCYVMPFASAASVAF
jgi:hypothetical protein